MSGFPSYPPSRISNVYNPSFYYSPSIGLSLNDTDLRYLKISGGSLAGSLIVGGSLDCGSLAIGGVPISTVGISQAFAHSRYLQLTGGTLTNALSISTASNNAFNITNTSASGLSNIKFNSTTRSMEIGLRGPSAATPDAFYIWDNTASGYRLTISSAGAMNVPGSITTPSISATIATAAQPSTTSVGSLTSVLLTPTDRLLSAGNTSVGCLWSSTLDRRYGMRQPDTNTFIMLCYSAGESFNDYMTWTHGNLTLTIAGSLAATNISGVLQTAAQPNITSIGTLTSLTVSGALNGILATAAQPNITSIGTLSTANSITCAQLILSSSTIGVNLGYGPLNWVSWKIQRDSTDPDLRIETSSVQNQESGVSLKLRYKSGSTGTGHLLKFETTTALKEFSIHTDNSANPYHLWCNNSDLTLTARSTTAANPNLYLSASGVVCIGKKSVISSNTWLEVNGSMMLSDNATTVSPSVRPQLNIFDSSQVTGSELNFIQFGKDRLTSNADYVLSGYYSSSGSSSDNYMVLRNGGSAGGITMNGFSNVRITGRVGGSYTSFGGPNSAVLELVGAVPSISVPSGYSYTSTGQASIGGGSVPMTLKVNGNSWTVGTAYVTSDGRLKKDVQSITSEDASKLLKLRPVRYTWKRDKDQTRQHGMIAQEVAEHLPELVWLVENKTDQEITDGIQQCLSYERFVPYLIKLCQLQEERILALDSYGPIQKFLKKII